MKKLSLFLLTVFTLFCGNIKAKSDYAAVTATTSSEVGVSITMNSVSVTMTLAPKEGGAPVAVGAPTSYKYTFPVEPGDYILSAYAGNGSTLNGTIELTITDEPEQAFNFITVTAGATNAGWTLGTDYTVSARVVSREGVPRVSVPGVSTTANRVTFLAYVGDTEYLQLIPSAAHTEEGYMTYNGFATLTANITTAAAIPMGYPYSVIAPENATLFVGYKTSHFVRFTEIEPKNAPVIQDGKATYNFNLANGQTYNYRVSQPGKLTNAGYFSMNTTLAPLEITAAMLDSDSPKRIDHDVKSNQGLNVGDIFLNINEKGHLKLEQGSTKQLLAMRTWELTDNSTNNYFIEPDFHYTVINENGTPDNSVVSINDKGLLTAHSNGTAIVLVTYDAIALNESYTMGRNWGAIWPENTGTFVVTVGNSPSGITSNIKINQGLNDGAKKVAGEAVDAEIDVFYYLEENDGFDYTFNPEGVSNVSIAYPAIGVESAGYTGFGADGVSYNQDGSYTVRLKFGRNIVKLTSASGQSEYQVFTAKPTKYLVSNYTNPSEPIQQGDQIGIQFSGLFHPANKLAGVYNMSGYVQFNGIPNGSSLILGSGQYTFGSAESAQLVKVTVPSDWNTSQTMDFTEGVIQVNGFGDPIGNHRYISPEYGRSPNFTAVSHKTYFGALPGVSVEIHETAYYKFSFTGLPENANIVVKNSGGATLTASESVYSQTYGTCSYEASCTGYQMLRGTVSISSQSPETQEIPLTMTTLATSDWDGVTHTEPEKVTAEESNTAGGQFEAMEGFYKISKGSELAWFANAVNAGTNAISAILTNNINLAGFAWTRIGNNTAAYQYKGIFDGGGHTISGLYINVTTTYQGLFGYINAATVKNLTVEGSVKSTATSAYSAGIIAYSAGNSIIENCHNKATVSGTAYTGGVLAYSTNAAIRITNSSNSGAITGSTNYIGGIIGYIVTGTTAVIDKVSNSGTIYAGTNYAGGIAGLSGAAQISNAYNTGNVNSAGATVAGISGSLTAAGSITNAYHAGVSKDNAIAGTTTGIRNNVYTIAGYTDATVKTTEQFASGEVTWLLGNAFGQEISANTFPLLNGAPVYKVTYTHNLDTETVLLYTNATLPEITKAGYAAVWKTAEDGTVITEVSGDSDLFVLFTLSAPTGLEGVPSETSIELSWTANAAATGYNVYLNGEWQEIVTANSCTIGNLTPSTQYIIEVEAVDAAGNKSAKASVIVSTTQPLSNDATLSGLKISNGTLTPQFSPDITGYTVDVDNSVEQITITATTNQESATVSGDGTHSLNPGENIFDIVITAEDGTQNTYTVKVIREPLVIEAGETKPAGADRMGQIELSLNLPSNVLFSGSFVLTLPDGFALDTQRTKLSDELNEPLMLTLTQNTDGSWLFTIGVNELHSAASNAYQKIVDIVYTINESVNSGKYELLVRDLSFVFENNTNVVADKITIGVTVDTSYVGINELNPAAPIVQIRDNYLYINTSVSERIQIYSVTGTLIYSGNKPAGEIFIPLTQKQGQVFVVKGSSGWAKKGIR